MIKLVKILAEIKRLGTELHSNQDLLVFVRTYQPLVVKALETNGEFEGIKEDMERDGMNYQQWLKDLSQTEVSFDALDDVTFSEVEIGPSIGISMSYQDKFNEREISSSIDVMDRRIYYITYSY